MDPGSEVCTDYMSKMSVLERADLAAVVEPARERALRGGQPTRCQRPGANPGNRGGPGHHAQEEAKLCKRLPAVPYSAPFSTMRSVLRALLQKHGCVALPGYP